MKIINMRERIRNLIAKKGARNRRDLAAAVVAGGMLFSGATAQGADIVVNGGFELDDTGWTNQGGNYTHPYGGISGPQLTEVGTITDYGFNDNISADAGSNFHGLTFPTTQTIDLVNVDLTARTSSTAKGVTHSAHGWQHAVMMCRRLLRSSTTSVQRPSASIAASKLFLRLPQT